MEISKLPLRIIVSLLIFGGAFFAFILIVVYPYHVSLANMDMEINNLNVRIEKQKILLPVFKTLLEKAQYKEPKILPFPKKAKLTRDNTDKISSIFQEIAQQSNIKLTDILLDTDSLINGSGYLMVNVITNGEFFDLRDFLFRLGELPYLEHIERIQILTQGSKGSEFRLKIWLARE